jgi:hypothetical protein
MHLECPSICKSVDCLSAHLAIFWFLGQQICHSQIFHFWSLSLPALHVCQLICRLFFLVYHLFSCLFFWRALDEAQYPTTPTSILQRTTTAHSYPLLPSPQRHTPAIRIVSYSGKIEGIDFQGEGLRKILYQAYHMLKNQICSNVDMSAFSNNLSCFPARKIIDR